MSNRALQDIRFIGGPSLDGFVSQACTAVQFGEAHYKRLCGAIRQDQLFHRKQWEYVYILRVLEYYDLLAPGVNGVGFGCGKEPLVAVMASEGVAVTATDIARRPGPTLTGVVAA